MAEYQFKFLNIDPEKPEGRGDGMLQRFDALLVALRDRESDFYARTVQFLVQSRMFNATQPEKASLSNSKFIGQYVTEVVRDKYGENFPAMMKKMIADSMQISEEILMVGLK